MNRHICQLVGLGLLVSPLVASARLSPEQLQKLPPPVTHTVSFAKDVQPIFEASCIKCHGRGRKQGDFRLDSRETLLQGGESGAVVILGKSGESLLIELVSGLDPDNVMPQKGSKLTREQVSVLRAWIDQGAPWEKGTSLGRLAPTNLKPPEPRIPAGPHALSSFNGIDLLLRPYYVANKVSPSDKVSDRIFARRVYLDVIGLLPEPAQLESFVADDHADKRDHLVKQLLADKRRYAEHWLTFWNDLLRNDYKGTGYIDDGRKQITDWLYSALANNLPFDQFVSQLVNPVAGAEGFVNGIVWRGVVNASQTPQMQAAQNISQVFMGVNLKCASCHDSFINDWTLADAYGLASVYAESELEMVRCDKPTGKKASMKFLYPELGSIDHQTSKPERLQRLAEIITDRQNGRLARTVVNRLWARLMGRGLVEPLDEMDRPAWNPDLLDWLAADLVENGYDLKKTLERILTSAAYQMPSVPATDVLASNYVFRGPLVRRLSAEQFTDAVSEVVGVWHQLPGTTQTDFSASSPNYILSEAESPAPARWIWNDSRAAEKVDPGTVYFRRRMQLEDKPTQASAVITCDNRFKLFVNGKEVSSGSDHNKPTVVDLLPHLRKGDNLLAISAVNTPAAPDKKDADQASPAGLLCYARIRQQRTEGGLPIVRVWDIATGDSWFCSTNKVDGWEKPEGNFAAEGWKSAVELGHVGMRPWKLERKFAQALSAAALVGQVRASLVAADPLMSALGRPNREQVMTLRASAATTLQGLEMTNGKTLAEQLEKGSERLVTQGPKSGRELVVTLFERALSRPPLPDELALSQELVGAAPGKEAVEDLLWTLAMLPEFQLIY